MLRHLDYPVHNDADEFPRGVVLVSTDEHQTQVTPLEAVILNALVTESATLNIKVSESAVE